MNLKDFRSHFRFTSGERNGILVLSTILVSLLIGRELYHDRKPESVDNTFTIETALQVRIDSLKKLNEMVSRDTIYPFNPNFITDFKVYQLGLPNEVFDRMQNFRASGKWVNSAAEFQKVTEIPDSALDKIRPYLRFPDWVKSSAGNKNKSSYDVELPYRAKADLNKATSSQLEEIYGIGPVLAKRIIVLRKKLKGFSHQDQLYGVYGLRDSVIARMWKRFAIKSPVGIQKLDLRKASASDLATIPGISFEIAKDIWEFNRLREGITELSELRKIERLTEEQFRVISVYLSTAQNE